MGCQAYEYSRKPSQNRLSREMLIGTFLALYRFLWDEAETQGMGGMKKGNEVSNL